MTDANDPIQKTIGELSILAPAGYALAFHIRYTTPTYLFQSYSEEWLRHYSENGLVMSDPTVHWGFENEGTCRWSELTQRDEAGVLEQAKTFGIQFGVTWALDLGDSRSVGSLARVDREFSDAECTDILQKMSALHTATSDLDALAPETAAALQKMAIKVTHPAG